MKLSLQALRALACLAALAPSAAALADEAPPAECARIDARVAKRKKFLDLRAQERLRYPTMPTFSPFCQEHPNDDDCQLLVNQKQEDLSRDVSELEMGSDGKTPVTDPVLVPLYRKRRALHCPSAK